MISGIYAIINTVNNRVYIGSSCDIERRFVNHRYRLNKGNHYNLDFQHEWNVFGGDVFVFEIIDYCVPELLSLLESNYIQQYWDHLYNRTLSTYRNLDADMSRAGEANGMFGKTHTEEARQSISESAMGNQRALGAVRSPEIRAMLSESASRRTGPDNPFYGRSHSEESKQKMAEANMGKLPVNTRNVEIDGEEYISLTEAARRLNVVPATILHRIKSPNPKYSNYRYLD